MNKNLMDKKYANKFKINVIIIAININNNAWL